MKNNILYSLFNGFKRGILIGLFLAILFSFYSSTGIFQPMSSAFISLFPNELIAFTVLIITWGGIGSIFTVTNLIFTHTDWSITKMTMVHATISYVLLLPIALFLDWISFDFIVIFRFTIAYILVYAFLWSKSMIKARKEVSSINKLI